MIFFVCNMVTLLIFILFDFEKILLADSQGGSSRGVNSLSGDFPGIQNNV